MCFSSLLRCFRSPGKVGLPDARLFSAALLALTPILGPTHARAAKNPLNTIEARAFDEQSPGIKTEPCSEGGVNLSSIHDGDYVAYKDYDFDSGVALFTARVAGPNPCTLEVRLDSPTGKLLGTCNFPGSGGWQTWRDLTCTVDNTQSGARAVYLVAHGNAGGRALLNVKSFVFLKTGALTDSDQVDLASRLDKPDDEPQAVKAWGMPETGFTDSFEDGRMTHWTGAGLQVAERGLDGRYALAATAEVPAFAYTPDVYINKTDTGGEWRSLAEAALSVDFVADAKEARPGLGFASRDGKQAIYVTFDAEHNALEAWRKLGDAPAQSIRRHPKLPTDPLPQTDREGTWKLRAGVKYRLQVDWSPYSNALIAFLYDDRGEKVTDFRTVIDLPAARRPLLVNSGGPARFDNVKFDPTLDAWNLRWEWKKDPVQTPDVCNPAVWKANGKFYMMTRKFGADTFHGVSMSADGIHWERVTREVAKSTGDMNVVVDPFGDGKWYITPGGANLPWWTSDGANDFKDWTKTGLTVGDIFGNSRIQEIVDTRRYPQLKPVSFEGKDYRFIAYTEDWNRLPKPHTVVLLSNTLTDWVLAGPEPLIPPGQQFWGEKGNAIGSAFPLPDGTILISSCSCTNEGYTGAPEPTNVSAIADGREPWKILKLATLPDAPVSRENVWYQGPNFGTAFYYDKETDTLLFYGGFHDYNIGMMRVRNFLHHL